MGVGGRFQSGPRCIVAQCRRSAPRNSVPICGSCWRWVSSETKIALQGHYDAVDNCHRWGVPNQLHSAEREAWVSFVNWSYARAVTLAAIESFEVRQEMALEDLKARASGSAPEEEEDHD